jgi:alkylation response protein AidB-like acyl-CoA dehydrogenase
LRRWQCLAEVAIEDLALVKLFEAHTDVLAIIAELDGHLPEAGTTWGMWAAEPPGARVGLRRYGQRIRLSGRKAWCSGAGYLSHALVTAWDGQSRQCLAAVDLSQAGVTVTNEGWHAVGMGRVASPDVIFNDAEASEVGAPDDYTTRAGFWQGGCGLAACWYGACLPLAHALADSVAARADPHAEAHLGTVDVTLRALRASLVEAAMWIDENPAGSAGALALRLRAAADNTAGVVHDRVGRALGAGPLCRDLRIAQRYADLPVFVRQTHGR